MPYDDRLFRLLEELDDDELLAIWTQALRMEPGEQEFDRSPRPVRLFLLSAEWRSAHGHSLANVWRGPHELPWKRILIDVADKLKPGWGWTGFTMDDGATDEQIESFILRYYDERARESWAAMTDAQREATAQQLDAELRASRRVADSAGNKAAVGTVTVAGLSSGIGAGLMTGAGALLLAQGATSALVGGVLGGTLYQIGLWIVVRVMGVLSGAQLAASGGAAAVGGALLSAPAALAFLANAVMSTAYRKSIPATLMLLTAHQLRAQLAEWEVT